MFTNDHAGRLICDDVGADLKYKLLFSFQNTHSFRLKIEFQIAVFGIIFSQIIIIEHRLVCGGFM